MTCFVYHLPLRDTGGIGWLEGVEFGARMLGAFIGELTPLLHHRRTQPSLPEAPKPTSKKKGKGKNKNKKANFKALPQATLDAVEEALGMCWNPDTLALIMPNFFSAPCLMGHEVNDGWYAAYPTRHLHACACLYVGGASAHASWKGSAECSCGDLAVFFITRANAAFCNALVKKVEEHCGAAVTLDISTNGIKSLAPIRRLAAAMPNIEQLSLASNELKSVAELGHFKGMEQIRCIVLQVCHPVVAQLAGGSFLSRTRLLMCTLQLGCV
jgi:hypothetical protein